MERRREEIETEVLKRVEEAKKIMETQMMEELEKRKQEQLLEDQKREVRISLLFGAYTCTVHNKIKSSSV